MKKLIIIGFIILTNSIYGVIDIQNEGKICMEMCSIGKDSVDLNFCETTILKGEGCCSYKECTSRNWKFYPYTVGEHIFRFKYHFLLLGFILLLFYARRRLKIAIQERNTQNK